MYEESESEHRYHDGNDREGHELAALCKETVCRTIGSVECVNHGESVDRHVQEKEDDKEKATYAHDKFLGN